MSIKISNVPDTSDDVCEGGCGSWKEHWENATEYVMGRCSVIHCNEYNYDNLVGGHVYNEDDNDGIEYIIPLCKEHNNPNQGLMEVTEDTIFIETDELYTCGEEYEDE